MAHFAKLVDGIVDSVVVVADEDCGGGQFPESEVVGQQFLASLGLGDGWLQTSYNHNFRGVYAGVGYSYEDVNDVFVEPTA